MEFPSSIRKTKSREIVWKILHESDSPLTAREIAQRAAELALAPSEEKKEKTVWLSSVYRALDAFEKEHLVTKSLLANNAESIYAPSSTGHHHYAICMNCKKRTELEMCPFEHEHALHMKDSDFMVVGHKVEVFGYCKECRGKMER